MDSMDWFANEMAPSLSLKKSSQKSTQMRHRRFGIARRRSKLKLMAGGEEATSKFNEHIANLQVSPLENRLSMPTCPTGSSKNGPSEQVRWAKPIEPCNVTTSCHSVTRDHQANHQRPKLDPLSYRTRRRRIRLIALCGDACTKSLSASLSQNLLSSLVILALLFLTSTSYLFAYQLTNNLIANNLPPKFITSSQGQASNSEIVVRVKEGSASIGKLIYTLKGEDPDEDPLTFGVLGNMASDLLRIENVPGNQANVYLRKELDRETTESYQVVITLTDGKLGRGNWVEDVNDNYPVFGPHRTAISIREDTKVPLVIETLEATDQDEGRFGQVIYKLDELDDTSGKGSALSSMFSIETVDGRGVISLIGSLDYEQKALYQLRVLAVDRAIEHERLTASTSILISVEDCDDRPPMFTFVPSITRIPENLPLGSPIVRVSAVDGDRGINNQIQYKLMSVNGQESGFERNLFSINANSGQISVAHELNRESDSDSWLAAPSLATNNRAKDQSSQPGSYVLQVRASEIGSSSSSSKDNSVATELTIILTDVNDETPSFNQVAYYGEILENSTPENLVTFVANPATSAQASDLSQPIAKVVDRDQGTNGTFSLHLEGEHSQLFDIWPREATNEANLMIKVATPIDTKPQSVFELDYERSKMFSFTIVAKEKYNNRELRTSSAQMTVFVKDANDNYPQFESELYKVEIPENAIRGMHICAVKATDSDSGIYGSQGIRYTEIRGEKANKFKLDPLTGVITLKTNEHGFDRETIAQHHLIVEARDNNGSGNRNTTQLLIILTDVNDQRPKFLLDQYEAFIYENELDFQSPLQVQAMDNDAQGTANSRISYSIVAGDPQQNFTIEPSTGRIRVRNSLVIKPTVGVNQNSGDSDILLESSGGSSGGSGLDFERIAQKRDDTRQFNLTIRATDSGLPEPLADTTRVIILVYDKNDHAPVFTRNIYSKSIREDAKEGSQVIQVLAQDGDHSPTNSKITYRISSGASDKFVIDSESGLISVATGANLDIDRVVGGQKRTNYLLNVIAFDGSFGPNQKSSSALVNITVIDVNNKPPEFVTLGAARQAASGGGQQNNQQGYQSNNNNNNNQAPMVVYVNEDAPYGLIVTRVVAIDLDSGAELRYSINYARSEARNEDMVLVEPALIKDLFSIEPTDGTIKVSKQLDRELFDQVKLRLQVEDIAAQTSDQIAHSYLLIKVTDINDNRPVFKKPLYKAVVNENSISGTSVITLTADDRDLNKTLKYSLDGSAEMMRLIRINPRSGEVTVNDKIDRELYPMINVTVKADDYGYPQPLTGSAQLLITVRDENDNNPIFVNASQLQPHPATADLVGLPDSFRNHNMNNDSSVYRLRSLGAHGRFETTMQPFEAPQTPSGDQGAKLPLLSPGAVAKIREDAPIGYQLAYVRAEDADVGNNGRVTYLLEPASSGGKFRIERDSGIISVSGTLDRELTRQYSLIIEACDNYDLGYSTGESRRAFTQVNIQVTDVNDNAPLISTNLQNSISEASSLAERANPAVFPTYDDFINSPGPYEQPLANCLFINEFQALNEPILTVTASDADDPSTINGQIDLAIVNNLPHNELFRLVSVVQSSRLVETSTSSPSTDYTGFGELSLDGAAGDERTRDTEEDSQAHKRSRRSPLEASHLFAPASRAFSISSAAGQRRSGSARTSSSSTSTDAPPVSATMASVRQRATSGHLGQSSSDNGELQVHVVVTQSLKERVGNYSILVRASDRGQPSLSSVKLINICVQDVNNHSPVFIRPALNHTIRVMENATLGTYVTQVEATDLDHGLNGELQYSLKPTNIQNNNNDLHSFKIDRLSGVISTAKLFNRQLRKYYTLRVQAQDFGKPTTLSSDIDINIMIVNSGQYQPEFDAQSQSLQFTENLAPGVEWFALLSTTNLDDDPALINANAANQLGTTGNPSVAWLTSPCYFIIDSDDQDQIFQLDRYTHRLSNQRPLDREKKANYTLLVQATNNCNKLPSAPIYSRPMEPARAASGDALSTVASIDYPSSALDVAQSRSARSIATDLVGAKSRDKKSIEHKSNQSMSEPAELVSGQDSFNQVAVDALLASDKSLLKVTIRVKDVNDNAPRFTQRVYTGGITTEADFGTVFMIVQAIDADADANGQVTYSIVKPIKRNLITSMSSQASSSGPVNKANNKNNQQVLARQRRAAPANPIATTTIRTPPLEDSSSMNNDIPMNEGDDLFVINPQTGEISLNFDPQKHMKGYFEFEILANDTEGLSDSAKVFIYLLRQDQRVKFVLRLTPQELRQRLNKFRSVFGNITGAIVNIDSYKYYENHDGTVDKKKTSLYLHFVNPDDNTIIDVDKVLTLIDNNIEYLDELYKEFHVLSSEAAHLPLSSSALIDPIDQIRTGLMGVASFLALILVLVIALCLNQRTRYERQLKAATVSAFGSSPLHLDPDYHSQSNLPNTNLHSQDPNPIWMNGYSEQDWLGAKTGANLANSGGGAANGVTGNRTMQEDGDYLSSENSDLNSLSGVNSVGGQLHYNATATATPRDSLNSSQGRVSGSGSGSTSTTNDRQALCRASRIGGGQPPVGNGAAGNGGSRGAKEPVEVVGVLKNGKTKEALASSGNQKKRQQVQEMAGNTGTHSTFGAFKEVTIYTDINHQTEYVQHQRQGANNLIRTVTNNQQQPNHQATSQVNKIASHFNAKHQQARAILNQNQQANQIFIGGQQQVANNHAQQRIIVHANGADVSQGIIKNNHQLNQQQQQSKSKKVVSLNNKPVGSEKRLTSAELGVNITTKPHQEDHNQHHNNMTADSFETNLSKLSILNLETTEL